MKKPPKLYNSTSRPLDLVISFWLASGHQTGWPREESAPIVGWDGEGGVWVAHPSTGDLMSSAEFLDAVLIHAEGPVVTVGKYRPRTYIHRPTPEPKQRLY